MSVLAWVSVWQRRKLATSVPVSFWLCRKEPSLFPSVVLTRKWTEKTVTLVEACISHMLWLHSQWPQFTALLKGSCLVLHIEYKAYSPDALWRYLTARHDWSSISLWIEEFQTQEAGSPQQNKWPPLSADVIDQNTCCNSYMRNKILDKLARYCNCETKIQWGKQKKRKILKNNNGGEGQNISLVPADCV